MEYRLIRPCGIMVIIIVQLLFFCAPTLQVQVESKDAKTYHQLGLTYAEKGDFDQAIFYFNKAIELDPTNAIVYSNRGAVYSAKGNRPVMLSFNS